MGGRGRGGAFYNSFKKRRRKIVVYFHRFEWYISVPVTATPTNRYGINGRPAALETPDSKRWNESSHVRIFERQATVMNARGHIMRDCERKQEGTHLAHGGDVRAHVEVVLQVSGTTSLREVPVQHKYDTTTTRGVSRGGGGGGGES